jgi:uncharacterized C2H2 Zn-finger protein
MSKPIKESAKIKRIASWYNQVPNFFWMILNLLPLVYFCSTRASPGYLYIFSGISFLSLFLPVSFFNAIQLSNRPAFYEKIGIRTVRKFTQDGDIINRMIRKRFRGYKVFDYRKEYRKHISKSYFFERFHFSMFMFFSLIIIYSIWMGFVFWALVLFLNNLVFNIYPNLLQQYNRLRLKALSTKSGNSGK